MDKEEFIEDFMEELQKELTDRGRNIEVTYETAYQDNGSLEASFSEDIWGAIQSKLDDPNRNGNFEPDDASSTISGDMSTLQYMDDYFIITLIGDLQGDEYRLTIKDR